MPVNQQNLSSTTPAAPAGNQLATWQSDSNLPRNDSAYVPSTGGVSVKTAGYQIVPADCGKLIVFEGSADGTFELPQAIPFAQWDVFIENNSVPSGSPPATPVLTVSPLSGSPPSGPDLDGSTGTITLNAGQGVYIASDGTNYFTERGMGGGSSLELETNGTPNADQSLLNFSNTTPAAPSGKTNVEWQNDGGGDLSAYMPVVVGDTGSGGSSGAVPAPPAGSAAAGKFLKADGTFAVPAGGAGNGGMWRLTPPVFSSFAWANQGGASDQGGTNFLSILAPGSGSNSLRMLYAAVPGSTPWDLFALIQISGSWNGSPYGGGIFVYDGTKVISFQVQGGSSSPSIDVYEWNSPTSFSGTSASDGIAGVSLSPVWLNIHNDGTNLYFYYSFDGVGVPGTSGGWRLLATIAVTAFLSAVTYYGFYADSDNSAPCSCTCLSFANAMTAN